MPISLGSHNIKEIAHGSQQIKEVYQGSNLVWRKPPSWDFIDDFERPLIGTTDWSGSGGVIAGSAPNRHLKKNTSAGSADYWTTRNFDYDDIEVETVLGPVDVGHVRAAIIIGNPQGTHIYVEFQANGGTLSHYTGSSWVQFAPVSAKPGGYTQGDKVTLRRVGTFVEFIVNGQVLGSGHSTYGRGVGSRRVALSVRAVSEWFQTRYGPTYDAVRIKQAT